MPPLAFCHLLQALQRLKMSKTASRWHVDSISLQWLKLKSLYSIKSIPHGILHCCFIQYSIKLFT
jgi:hypothetical protein